MSLGTILLIVLVIALLGGFSGIGGGRFYGTGYYGGGGLGLVLIVVLILVVLGKICKQYPRIRGRRGYCSFNALAAVVKAVWASLLSAKALRADTNACWAFSFSPSTV